MASSNKISLAKRLSSVLTEAEIGALVEAFFAVVSPKKQEEAIAQLSEDTQKTIRAILAPPAKASKQKGKKASSKASTRDTPSLAKQEQTWASLWKEWNAIIFAATKENGDYIEQEASWEEPYFNEYQFVQDLEQVATKMKPLLPIAFEHGFQPYGSFVEAVEEATADADNSLEDWMSPIESFEIEPELTFCVVQWEWLAMRAEGHSAFDVVQQIHEYEHDWKKIYLSDHIVLDFFTQISDADKQTIFDGLTAEKNTPTWQYALGNPRSPWHTLYLDLIEKYSPDRYQDTLRATIPQKWSNGLPIIEALLEQSNTTEANAVLAETLKSWLASYKGPQGWEPETDLLMAHVTQYDRNYQGILSILNHYKTIAQTLNQPDRVAALEIQIAAFTHCFDWEKMLGAFVIHPLPGSVRTLLFTAWCQYIVKRSVPYHYPDWARDRSSYGYIRRQPTQETWWVEWLLDAIEADIEAGIEAGIEVDLEADSQSSLKGKDRFQEKLLHWLASLPGELTSLGENIDYLTLLSADLAAIAPTIPNQYPLFYEIAIPAQERDKDHANARQRYLKRYMPEDLIDRVMMYWKSNVVNFVPNPERVSGADYTIHARWMAVLQELVPSVYSSLLAQWQQTHKRRRNLWKAMKKRGLGG